jgi:hypothetical protein
MSEQRPLRSTPPTTPSAGLRPEAPVRTAPPPRPQHSKPDANPLRLLLGLAGIASASALVTAMLPSVSPTEVVVAADTTGMTDVVPEPSVLHVTRYVTLEPGQTAPPQSSVLIKPQPTPHVTVKVVKKVQAVTRQSGKP